MRRSIEHRDAGRVVAAIFEATQSLHENGDDVPFSDRSDNAAHLTVLPDFEGALVCLRVRPYRSGRSASSSASATRLTTGRRLRPEVLEINPLRRLSASAFRPFPPREAVPGPPQGTSGWTTARNAGRTDSRW